MATPEQQLNEIFQRTVNEAIENPDAAIDGALADPSTLANRDEETAEAGTGQGDPSLVRGRARC